MTTCCILCKRKTVAEVIVSDYWDWPNVQQLAFCSEKCFRKWVIRKGKKWSK